jgi:hypothetical protein
LNSICLHGFSIFSRCKHPRTSAIRQHNPCTSVLQWVGGVIF